jgi:hypothetical protein
MATRPNEIVSEAMARALLGMSQRYAITVLAATRVWRVPLRQVIESTGLSGFLSDGGDANLASNAYMRFEKHAP